MPTLQSACEFYKQSVYDTHDNKIGDVNDVLLDENGQVSAVILGVGGLLGIGEKNVAVPFKAIQITEKSGNSLRACGGSGLTD